jgi:hypothetical protein
MICENEKGCPAPYFVRKLDSQSVAEARSVSRLCDRDSGGLRPVLTRTSAVSA